MLFLDDDPLVAVEAQVSGDGDQSPREHVEAVHVSRRGSDQPEPFRIGQGQGASGSGQRNLAASG